jgi:ribosomal protein S15P/S13E
MRTFKQFLTEREDLYNLTNADLEKSQGHTHDVKLADKQINFLRRHLPEHPKAKENTSLIATLSKSRDFSKVKHVIPPEKK